MNMQRLLLALPMIFLVACNDSSDSQQTAGNSGNAAEVGDAKQPELSARFLIDGPDLFQADVQQANLRCQSAMPGIPFRAEWNDPDTTMAVLVTGFPKDDGTDDTRVDNFQVAYFGENTQKNANLTSAALTVKVIQKAGMSSFYEVNAQGQFSEGGNFTAKGVCRA